MADLENDEEQQEQRIARPQPSLMPPVAARGLSAPVQSAPTGSTGELENEGLASHLASRPIASPSPLEARTTADQNEMSRLQSTGSGISQIARAHPVAGGILRGLGTVGSIVGSVDPFARRILPNIPGTEEHHNQLLRQESGRIGEDLGEEQKEAATAESGAKTEQEQAAAEKDRAQADALRHPEVKPKEEKWDVFPGFTDTDGTPLIREENSGQVVRASDKKPATGFHQDKEPTFQTDKVVRIVNGVPHEILIDKQTGKDVQDLGQTKLPGESPDQKRNASEQAQVEREARTNIRKAEGQYRDTEKSVGQLSSAIEQAKDGNGLLTSFVPTMEVLGINAANGVHRISPAEAQAANLPGSFVERFNSWFDKAAQGKTTPQLVKEGKELANILLKSSYQRYKSTYDDEHGIVSGYGIKDFDKRVPALPETGGGENQAGGGVEYKAGLVRNGYKFKGGDPTDKNNWEAVPAVKK
jgi:hypothetical protein